MWELIYFLLYLLKSRTIDNSMCVDIGRGRRSIRTGLWNHQLTRSHSSTWNNQVLNPSSQQASWPPKSLDSWIEVCTLLGKPIKNPLIKPLLSLDSAVCSLQNIACSFQSENYGCPCIYQWIPTILRKPLQKHIKFFNGFRRLSLQCAGKC